VVIKNFLSEQEIETLIMEYRTKVNTASENKNVKLCAMNEELTKKLTSKIMSYYAESLENNVDNPIDTPFHKGIFVDNSIAILPWHQDAESLFLFQTHDIVKAYIPIIKELPNISGLSLISNEYVDTLQSKDIIRNRGATIFRESPAGTFLIDDSTDERIKVDLDLNNHVSPSLMSGDLLLFNGDVIHKTQDNLTHRVAASFMFARGNDKISMDVLDSGGDRKKQYIYNNHQTYDRVRDKFKALNATTLAIRDVF
jgi:hypothetical protein